MFPLLRHAAITTVGLLAPGRSRVCALHLIRQIALARVQQRVIAWSPPILSPIRATRAHRSPPNAGADNCHHQKHGLTEDEHVALGPAANSERTKTVDSIDTAILEFARRWMPFGGPRPERVLVEFGMTTAR